MPRPAPITITYHPIGATIPCTERSRDPIMAEARLLLVEPDRAIADLFTLVLAEEGYMVERAHSPQEALALLAGCGPGAFDVVLSTPCAAPRAPYAWLARLRAWTCAPIVICTRDAAVHYSDYRARGYAAVIEEPCDLQDVLNVVAALLRRPPAAAQDQWGSLYKS